MSTLDTRLIAAATLFAAVAGAGSLSAQENYEIQVYGSETVPRGVTMFELHSNYTLMGSKLSPGGALSPTNHALHETVEITHGFNDWSELGFYWFTSVPSGQSWQWVGTHLRPRVRVPDSWGWPVGVSISQEFGYSKAAFSDGDTWTYELRPIIDKQMGPWYVSINPALEKSLRGESANVPFVFSPNVDVGYDVTKKVNLSVEYYGATGPINRLDPIREQQHQVFLATNLDFGPDWEFNFGYGTTLTASGDKHIVKMILGRRVGK
jgi:hypothetical protein